MQNELISIIVPVYKVEQYLDRCLNTIVNQTYKNLEIILVDDGSPDNCPQMCDEWAKKDNRIKVIHIENDGVANARNQGIAMASGELIGFVDSDDYIEPTMFEHLYDNLIKHNSDISVCGYQINEEADVDENVKSISQLDALKLICSGDYKYGMLWNKLYRKALFNGVEIPRFVCCEDLTANYYLFKKARKIVESDKKLYHYYQNENSVVHDNFGIGAFDAVYSKEIMLKNEKNTELEEYAIRGLVRSCFVVLSGVIRNDKCTDKYDYLRNYILEHKMEIICSSNYSVKEKIKTIILAISPNLYSKFI